MAQRFAYHLNAFLTSSPVELLQEFLKCLLPNTERLAHLPSLARIRTHMLA
jgi:hypothetical protein